MKEVSADVQGVSGELFLIYGSNIIHWFRFLQSLVILIKKKVMNQVSKLYTV